MNRSMQRAGFLFLLLFPGLGVFLLYRLIPLGWNVVLSFQSWQPIRQNEFIGLFHYEEMFVYDPAFFQVVGNTLIFLLVTPITIVIALALALALNGQVRGRGLYRTAIFVSYPIMIISVGVIWRWLYDGRFGLLNYVLQVVGIIEEPHGFLVHSNTALPAVMVAAIWQLVGFFMLVLLTGLQSIPNSLYEAAVIDGAGWFRRLRRITIPLLKPSLFLCGMLGLIASFTSFDLIYIMTSGGPGHSTELLISYIYEQAFELGKYDYAAALTVVMVVLFMIFALVMNALSGGEAGRVDTGDM